MTSRAPAIRTAIIRSAGRALVGAATAPASPPRGMSGSVSTNPKAPWINSMIPTAIRTPSTKPHPASRQGWLGGRFWGGGGAAGMSLLLGRHDDAPHDDV